MTAQVLTSVEWHDPLVDGIGSRIRRVRTEARLKQKDVARVMKRSQAQVSQWERGEDTAQYDQLLGGLVRLAREAQVTLDYLVTGSDPSRPTDARGSAVAFARMCGYHEDAIAHAEQVSGVNLGAREWFRLIEGRHDQIIHGNSG